MIKLFKKLNIAYYISIVAILLPWLVFFVYCLINQMDFAFIASSVAVLILSFLVVSVLSAISMVKHTKIVNILNNDCDPVKFLNCYYPLIERKTSPKINSALLINLAAGYISAGDLNNARLALQSVDVSIINDPTIKIAYYSQWTFVFENENDIQNAQATLVYMKEVIDNEIKKPEIQKIMHRRYNNHIAIINLMSHSYYGVEQTMKTSLSESEYMIEKVGAHYVLGVMYFEQNRIEDAKYSLRFTVENGGTLADVEKAKKLLLQIDNR